MKHSYRPNPDILLVAEHPPFCEAQAEINNIPTRQRYMEILLIIIEGFKLLCSYGANPLFCLKIIADMEIIRALRIDRITDSRIVIKLFFKFSILYI